jgi:diketogulonate reductase-like aldo/keto reductase
MAERVERRAGEIAALRAGVDLGMTLIDTAEMYGSGAAEELIAEALGDRRGELFLVDKVMPQNASRHGTIAACEASLRRLKTDRIDLYLLHWRGNVPLEETMAAFQELAAAGKIRYWGVSNFDVDDMNEMSGLKRGAAPAANQVLYNLMRRGIEYDLVPWCQAHGIPIMAYSPVEQGRLLKNRTLKRVADRLAVTPAQLALGWVLRQANVVAIPKAGSPQHVRENRAAVELRLTAEDLAELDQAFLPPGKAKPLEMI